jgi:hypothetical protein
MRWRSDIPGAPQNAAAEVARIVADDIAGGIATLHLVVGAATPALPGDQAEALRFLTRRLGEMTAELRMELAHIDAPAPAPRRKRLMARQ